MADNIDITPGTGAAVATDDVSGVHFQKVKLDLGGDGASSPLVRGQQAKADSLPVALASDQDALPVTDNSGSLTVDDGGNSLTVDGTVTVQDGGGSLTVDGSVAIGSALPAGDNNIGNVDLASAIPAGDNLVGRVKLSDGTTVVDVVDLDTRNALAVAIVDGNGDQITSFGGGGGGSGTEYTEDAAAAANPVGGLLIARRRDTPSGETSADGDNVALNATDKGELYVKHLDAVPVTDNGGSLSIDDGGGEITVNGAVTVSGTVDLGATDNAVLDAIAASLATLDNIVGGNEAQVDIVGALPAGTNNIGDVDVLSVNGQSAHDAAVAGNPVRVGGRAESTELSAVADGDTVDLIADLTGKQVVMPYAVPERLVSGVTAAITNTSNTQVLAAAGAGLRNYVTSLLVTNSHASVGTLVEIKDGTTVIWRGYAPPGGGGFAVSFPSPLRGTANTAINAANVTTSSNTYVSAAGFVAP